MSVGVALGIERQGLHARAARHRPDCIQSPPWVGRGSVRASHSERFSALV